MLGHFVGDYLSQNEWLAINKSGPGVKGHVACTIHVLLYTLAIAAFTSWNLAYLLVVFWPHWLIDRTGFAWHFLALKNGSYVKDKVNPNPWVPPVYIFNDNTLHWVCLWFTVRLFF